MTVHVQCIVFSHHILLFVQCEVTKGPYTSILIISLIWVYTFHLCMTIYIYMHSPPPPPQTSHPYISDLSNPSIPSHDMSISCWSITSPSPTHVTQHPLPFPTRFPRTHSPSLHHSLTPLPMLTWSINLMMPICHYLQPILSHPPSFPFPLPIPSHQ